MEGLNDYSNSNFEQTCHLCINLCALIVIPPIENLHNMGYNVHWIDIYFMRHIYAYPPYSDREIFQILLAPLLNLLLQARNEQHLMYHSRNIS